MVQFLRNAEPQWLTIAFLTIVMPAEFQGVEYALHWLRGTPHLRVAEIVSIVISACSTLFNWYAMRRGACSWAEKGRVLRVIYAACRCSSFVLSLHFPGPRRTKLYKAAAVAA
jgi:hypothetical protein